MMIMFSFLLFFSVGIMAVECFRQAFKPIIRHLQPHIDRALTQNKKAVIKSTPMRVNNITAY